MKFCPYTNVQSAPIVYGPLRCSLGDSDPLCASYLCGGSVRVVVPLKTPQVAKTTNEQQYKVNTKRSQVSYDSRTYSAPHPPPPLCASALLPWCTRTITRTQQYIKTKEAALKVQSWGRMATARKSYQTDRSRAITVQCLARKRSAKSELRKRKKEKDNVDALQAKIKAFEVRMHRNRALNVSTDRPDAFFFLSLCVCDVIPYVVDRSILLRHVFLVSVFCCGCVFLRCHTRFGV